MSPAGPNRRGRGPALTPCRQPGCPELTRAGYCEDHRLEQRRDSDRRRPSASVRGYDSKWRRTRGRYLQLHPTCEEPGCADDAAEVHHLDGLGPLGPDGHRHSNLEALCSTHHARRTAAEQPGGWNT